MEWSYLKLVLSAITNSRNNKSQIMENKAVLYVLIALLNVILLNEEKKTIS